MSKRTTTLGQLAELVGGRIQGDSHLPIYGAEVLGEVAAGEITLVDHLDRIKHLNTTASDRRCAGRKYRASSRLVRRIIQLCKTAIVVADVHAAFATIVSPLSSAARASRDRHQPRARSSAPRPAAAKM